MIHLPVSNSGPPYFFSSPFYFMIQEFCDTETWDNWAPCFFGSSCHQWNHWNAGISFKETFLSPLPFVWRSHVYLNLNWLPAIKFFSLSCSHPTHLADHYPSLFLVYNVRCDTREVSSYSRTISSHHLPCLLLWDSFLSTLKLPMPWNCCFACFWTATTLWSWCWYRNSSWTYLHSGAAILYHCGATWKPLFWSRKNLWPPIVSHH